MSNGRSEPTAGTPVGAVLVVGGGIAGMQASLDLAELGFKVYLAEAQAAIGGKMAQLDKTFPTNDCAMCTISPRLVQAGRHPNIEWTRRAKRATSLSACASSPAGSSRRSAWPATTASRSAP